VQVSRHAAYGRAGQALFSTVTLLPLFWNDSTAPLAAQHDTGKLSGIGDKQAESAARSRLSACRA
jgi:hypothetical protein